MEKFSMRMKDKSENYELTSYLKNLELKFV